ncbi:MAG: epoxide hydrolase [Novosphingobium sp.]|nr:epoxide hydrolase [Novosphingobium sp.]
MTAQPFEIAVPQADLDELNLRLANTRWADDLGNKDWRYGVERGWLEVMVAYWRDEYDWRETERQINAVPNFKVEIDGQPIHFQHIRGKGPDPMPLLLLHGWPWTFRDFHKLIGPLTDPAAHGGEAGQSFDLIIPSLPGYAFSMPLAKTGLNVPSHAQMFRTLMRDVLGYERYAVAGGDWGATITTQMGHMFPEDVIGVLASIPYFPGLDLMDLVPEAYAVDEQWMVARKAETAEVIMSHFVVQSTDPQTLAYALVDSPGGTAAWLWERRRSWSDCEGDVLSAFTRDELCDLASIFWLTRSIGPSMRGYWEHARAGGLPMKPVHDRQPPIEVPCAFTVFPKEVMLIPRAVAERGANLRRWTLMQRGGHFGLAENPDETVAELRAFFATLR